MTAESQGVCHLRNVLVEKTPQYLDYLLFLVWFYTCKLRCTGDFVSRDCLRAMCYLKCCATYKSILQKISEALAKGKSEDFSIKLSANATWKS